MSETTKEEIDAIFDDVTKEDESSFEDEMFGDPQWFKFATPGDQIAGEVTEIQTKAAEGDYPEQKVITVKRTNGEEWYVPFNSNKTFLMAMLAGIKVGDILGAKFIDEIPASKKGYHPAKKINVRIKRDGEFLKQEYDKEQSAEHYAAQIVDQKAEQK